MTPLGPDPGDARAGFLHDTGRLIFGTTGGARTGSRLNALSLRSPAEAGQVPIRFVWPRANHPIDAPPRAQVLAPLSRSEALYTAMHQIVRVRTQATFLKRYDAQRRCLPSSTSRRPPLA